MEGKITTIYILIFGMSQSNALLAVPTKWSDLFSSLNPYQNENAFNLEEAEVGEPRIGFVQVP